jgi:hypothetical protein
MMPCSHPYGCKTIEGHAGSRPMTEGSCSARGGSFPIPEGRFWGDSILKSPAFSSNGHRERRAEARGERASGREAAEPVETSAGATRRAASVRASPGHAASAAQRPGESALPASHDYRRRPSALPNACAQTPSFSAQRVPPTRSARACARDAPRARRPLARFSSSPSLRLLIVPKTPLL